MDKSTIWTTIASEAYSNRRDLSGIYIRQLLRKDQSGVSKAVFPDRDVSDLEAAAQENELGARKAYKLLFDNRFQKRG